MKRRIVKQGAATLTISLPAFWTKKHRLKNGDEITIELINDDLLISKEALKSEKKKEIILITDTKTYVRNIVITAYCQGYDTLIVYFNDESSYQTLLEVLKHYIIGFDVIKKEKAFCVLENITEPSIEQFETIFQKVLYNTSLLIDQTEQRIQGTIQFKEYAEVMLRIHQYENFCKRLLSKKNKFDENVGEFCIFLNHVAQAAKEIHHLNKYLDKEPLTIKHIHFYDVLKQCRVLIQEGYLKKDHQSIANLHVLISKRFIAADFDKVLLQKGKDNVIIYHIIASIRHLFLASNALLGLIS